MIAGIFVPTVFTLPPNQILTCIGVGLLVWRPKTAETAAMYRALTRNDHTRYTRPL